MNDCKLAIACISAEYAESDNCRMEIQFAAKSLRKPVIAVVVGETHSLASTKSGGVSFFLRPAPPTNKITNFEHVMTIACQ